MSKFGDTCTVDFSVSMSKACERLFRLGQVARMATFDAEQMCASVMVLKQYEWHRSFYNKQVADFDKKLLSSGTETRQFPMAKQRTVMSHGTCSHKLKAARRKARKNKH